MKSRGLCLAFACFSLYAAAVDVEGSIATNDVCSDLSSLNGTRATLDDGSQWSTGVRLDGSFNIRGVEAGQYVLSVLSHDYTFDQVIIRISSNDSTVRPTILPYIPGTPMATTATPIKLPYPITLYARRKNQYYVPHESFDVLGMFRNPMMLLMVFAGVMVFASPYLMKNLDPEAVKDMQDRRASVAKIQGSLENMDIGGGIADWLSSGAPEPERPKPSAVADRKAPTSGVRSRPNKGKRK